MKNTVIQFELSLICLSVCLLSACGGGGTGVVPAQSLAPVATTNVTTTVMDGLIENALVCVDANNNGLCEPTETQGRTDAVGQVTLAIATAELATAHLVALIGLDAIDADTGPVATAYTLQAPAGKHSVISPLTHMVKTKIDADHASGATTSVDTAEKFVQTQASLTVSVFDNFIAKRDTDADARKAGEVARLLVVSTQESKKAVAVTGSCDPLVSQGRSREKDEDHSDESHIDDDLVKRLPEIRKLIDDIANVCSSKKSKDAIKNCDDDYKRKARIVSICPAHAPIAQTITFASPALQIIGSAAPALVAASTSGLTVNFASNTPSICTVNGTALTLVAPGSCSVTASQSGDATYAAATQVLRTFTVAAAPGATIQTITFTPPASQTIGTAVPALVATASSGLAITFTSFTPSVCTVSGTSLILLTAGACTVTASQSGNSSYAAATPVLGTFAVSAPAVPMSQTIAFSMPADQTLGVTTSPLKATASSGLVVIFASNTPAVCGVSGTTLSLLAAGACTVTANQAGNSSYAAAATVSRALTVAAVATPTVSASNGKLVYNLVFNGASCATCHTASPALNVSKVLRGANSANSILNAINNNTGGMGLLKGAYTTSQLNDIAAYLATPGL